MGRQLFVRQLFVGPGAGAGHLFKHFGKAGHVVKSAAKAGFGNAIPQQEAGTCVVDALFTNDLDKGLALPFLKIAAEGRGMHVREAPGFGKRYLFQEILLDIGMHGCQAIGRQATESAGMPTIGDQVDAFVADYAKQNRSSSLGSIETRLRRFREA